MYWFSVFPASQQTPPRVNPFRPQSACLYLKCTFTFLGQKKTLAAWRTVSLTQRGWRRLSFHSVSAEEGARAPCTASSEGLHSAQEALPTGGRGLTKEEI